MPNPTWWHLGRIVQIKNTKVWKITDLMRIVCPVHWLIRRKQYLIITSWKPWWTEVSSKKFEIRILGTELEILRRTPWSRLREQNSVYKEFLEIVGNDKPTGSVWKEDNCSSRHDMNKRGKSSPSNPSPNPILQRNEKNRELEVPVVERLDGLAKIISEELATTHFVKSGTLQNACSAKPKMVVGFGEKSAHSHIVRLTHSRRKGPKRMITKMK